MEKLFEYNPDTKKYRELSGVADIHLTDDVMFWDTETTGLSWKRDRIFCHSFSGWSGMVYVLINREYEPALKKFVLGAEAGEVETFLHQMLEDEALPKFIYNAKFDVLMVLQDGCVVKNEVDAFILMKLFPKLLTGYKLKEHVAPQFLGLKTDAKDDIDDFFKGGKTVATEVRKPGQKYIMTIQQNLFDSADDKLLAKTKTSSPRKPKEKMGDKEYIQLPDDILVPYAGEDIVLLRAVVLKCFNDGKEHYTEIGELLEIENYIQREVVKEMEVTGCAIDVPLLKSEQPAYAAKAAEALEKFYIAAGVDRESFDVQSADCLKDLYYRTLGEPIQNYTKAAKEINKTELIQMPFEKRMEYAAVDKWALAKMSHPSAKLLMEFNKFDGIADGFIPNLIENSYEEDGGYVTHASFNQLGAVSGRLSCSQPNLENLPNPKEESDGLVLRKAIIARAGYQILSIDESQIEYRLFAHYIKNPVIIQAFKDGVDFHQRTADMLGVERKAAKTINFGLIYGMGAAALGDKLNVTTEDAKKIMDAYFKAIPEIKTFRNQITEAINTKGYVRTILGRRGYLEKRFAYTGLNRVVQGSAADLFKKAFVEIHKFLKAGEYRTRIINLVHDEVLFELHNDEHAIIPELCRIMRDVGKDLRVPLEVNCEIGPNWGSMTELKQEVA